MLLPRSRFQSVKILSQIGQSFERRNHEKKFECRIFKFIYPHALLTFCVLSMLPQQEREPLSRFSLCSYLVWWFVYLICGRGKHHINRRIHNLSCIQLSWKHFLFFMHEGFTYDLIYCFSEPFPHVRLIKLILSIDFSVWFDFLMISGIIISCHLRCMFSRFDWDAIVCRPLDYNQVQIYMLKLINIFFLLFMEKKSAKEYSVAISVE